MKVNYQILIKLCATDSWMHIRRTVGQTTLSNSIVKLHCSLPFLIPSVCYMSHPYLSSWFDCLNSMRQRAQIVQLLIIKSAPDFCYFTLLSQNIFSALVFKHPWFVLFPTVTPHCMNHILYSKRVLTSKLSYWNTHMYKTHYKKGKKKGKAIPVTGRGGP
jgi:hypothetical protein